VTRQSGNLELIGRASYTLGETLIAQGDYAGGRAAMEETLEIARKLGHLEGEAYALRDIGVAARGLGDGSAALASLREALLLLRRLEQHHPLIETLAWIARVYQDQGKREDAARLFGAVDRLAKERNVSFGPDTALPDSDELIRMSAADADWAAAMSVGATLSLDDTMALALGE
jgi:tetratricopeptide (TPR) repeat protein